MFLNNRYHDPTLGAFVSVDPLVSLTGQPYSYGSNNPVTFSDPSGLCASEPGQAAACFGGGPGSISQAGIPIGGCSGQAAYCVGDTFNDAARQFDQNHSATDRYDAQKVADWFDPIGRNVSGFGPCNSGYDACRFAQASLGYWNSGQSAWWITDPFSAGFAGYVAGERYAISVGELWTAILVTLAPLAAKWATPAGIAAPARFATSAIDDLLASGRQVSGRFPKSANANEVLLRRGADGSVTHYQVYGRDGLPIRRVDVTGASHAGVPTPHVLEFEQHVNPTTGEVFVRPGDTVRPALPGGGSRCRVIVSTRCQPAKPWTGEQPSAAIAS